MKHLLLFILLSFTALTSFTQNKIGIGTNSPTHQLHTTQGVRHESLSGAGLRTVLATSNGVLTTEAYIKIDSAKVNVNSAIPDSSCAGLTSTINISGWPLSIDPTSLSVKVNIKHPVTPDLVGILITPYNDSLILFYGIGLDSNFTNTEITDLTSMDLFNSSNPFSGKFKPMPYSGSLGLCDFSATINKFSEIGGTNPINPNGQWKLYVSDMDLYNIYYGPILGNVTNDTGSLISWEILRNEPIDYTTLNNNNYYARWSFGTLNNNSSIYEKNDTLSLLNNTVKFLGNAYHINNVGIGTEPLGDVGLSVRSVNTAIQTINGYLNTKYSSNLLSTYDKIPFLTGLDVGVFGNAFNDWSAVNAENGYGGVFASLDSTSTIANKYVKLAGTSLNPLAVFMGGKIGVNTNYPTSKPVKKGILS